MTKLPLVAIVAAAAALAGPGTAQAQVAGSLLVKLGWNRIMPKVVSGDLSAPAIPGSKIDIESADSAIITATYMLTDNVSVEALGGLPYKHDVVGAGSVDGVGKIGTIHQISPTVMLQYRFFPAVAVFRPYLGAGVTWAKFYDSKGSASLTAVTNPGGAPTEIGGDTSFGATIEAGGNYKIDNHWFVDATVLKTFIKTNAPLSTGQSISAKLNPVSVSFSVGYTF